MPASKRKPVAIAEATQELKAGDVLSLLAAKPATLGAERFEQSIAPVGLDLAHAPKRGAEELNPTMQIRLPVRRRRLGGIVAAAVGACAVILIAAALMQHERAEALAATTPPAPSIASSATSPTPSVSAAQSPSTPATAPVAASPAAPDPSSVGTLRLQGRAAMSRTWLDGKKLTSGTTSVALSCGTHKIKIGTNRAHSIDVPCAGEVVITR